jgi:hypothetical protein
MSEGLNLVIRTFRDAVFAGIIWILVIWIDFTTQLGYKPSSDSKLFGVLQPLADTIKNLGSTIALLVLAALIGSVSIQVFRAPSLWVCNLASTAVRVVERVIIAVLDKLRNRRTLRRYDTWEPIPVDPARRIIHHHREAIMLKGGSPERNARLEQLVYSEFDLLRRRELYDPTKRDGLIQELYNAASFRLAMIVPLFAIVISLAIRFGPGFAVLIPFPFIIAFQAMGYRAQCDRELEDLIWPKLNLDRMLNKLDGTRDAHPDRQRQLCAYPWRASPLDVRACSGIDRRWR